MTQVPECVPFVDNPSRGNVAFKIIGQRNAGDNEAIPRTWFFWMAVHRSALLEIAERETERHSFQRNDSLARMGP